MRSPRGNVGRRNRTTSASPATPISSRQATRVNGPTLSRAILIHRNDEPQIKPSVQNVTQSRSFIHTSPLFFFFRPQGRAPPPSANSRRLVLSPPRPE